MTNPYVWTDDAMLNDMADENPSIINENLNYLKYEADGSYNYGVPYSVNSGVKNASGYVNFIAKVSNNEVSFAGSSFDAGTAYGGIDARGIAVSGSTVYVVDTITDKVYKSIDGGATWDGGTLYGGVNATGIAVSGSTVYVVDTNTDKVYKSIDTPITLTYPDGTYTSFDSLANISTLSTDGTWYFLIEKGSTSAIATKSTITEDYVFPSSPTNGDYHVDISVKPLKAYKRVSGAWIETQFVKLGEAARTSGTLATPISYAFNGKYISADVACVGTKTETVFNHNIGTNLVRAEHYLRCLTTQLGYAVGEVIKTTSQAQSGYTVPLFPYVINNKTIGVTTGSVGSYYAISKSTGVNNSLTPANWKQFTKVERDY